MQLSLDHVLSGLSLVAPQMESGDAETVPPSRRCLFADVRQAVAGAEGFEIPLGPDADHVLERNPSPVVMEPQGTPSASHILERRNEGWVLCLVEGTPMPGGGEWAGLVVDDGKGRKTDLFLVGADNLNEAQRGSLVLLAPDSPWLGTVYQDRQHAAGDASALAAGTFEGTLGIGAVGRGLQVESSHNGFLLATEAGWEQRVTLEGEVGQGGRLRFRLRAEDLVPGANRCVFRLRSGIGAESVVLGRVLVEAGYVPRSPVLADENPRILHGLPGPVVHMGCWFANPFFRKIQLRRPAAGIRVGWEGFPLAAPRDLAGLLDRSSNPDDELGRTIEGGAVGILRFKCQEDPEAPERGPRNTTLLFSGKNVSQLRVRVEMRTLRVVSPFPGLDRGDDDHGAAGNAPVSPAADSTR